MEWTPDVGSGLHLDASGPAPLIANVSRHAPHYGHYIGFRIGDGPIYDARFII
jgi:hypothetical protein